MLIFTEPRRRPVSALAEVFGENGPRSLAKITATWQWLSSRCDARSMSFLQSAVRYPADPRPLDDKGVERREKGESENVHELVKEENDHPGYSCERAPWALVTGVGPLNFQLHRTTVSCPRPEHECQLPA